MKSSRNTLLFLIVFVLLFQNIYGQGDSLLVDSSFVPLFLNIDKNPPSIITDRKEYFFDKSILYQKELNYYVLGGLGAVYASAVAGVHIYQANAWWKNKRTKFHFQNDWEYSLWIDKVGHTYGTMLIAHAFAAGLEASNLDSERSIIFGSVGALLYQLYVEVEDGFGPEWGFSPGDATFDLLGALYPISQYYFPYLSNYKLKFGYYPRQLNEKGLIAGQKHIIIDDYEGQKFWLSVRMEEVLPKSLSKYWPDFLMLAFGMGVTRLDGIGGGQRDYYIALDFDTEWIPLFGPGWQFVKNTLNYYHFPLPGIRITNNVVFLGLTF